MQFKEELSFMEGKAVGGRYEAKLQCLHQKRDESNL